MKTLKTWFNPFLFTDCLLKREIVCKLCGGNESCQSTAHIVINDNSRQSWHNSQGMDNIIMWSDIIKYC